MRPSSLRFAVLCVCAAALVLSPVFAQSFEVASVKPNTSGASSSNTNTRPGGRFNATNVELRLLIREAYRLQDFQLIDAPDWTRAEHFDITATAGREAQSDEMRLMLQALLADRFSLVVHKETRELPIYALQLARTDGKLGSQLTKAEIDCTKETPQLAIPCGTNTNSSNNSATMRAGSVPMSSLAPTLSMWVNRFVIDRTGLTGGYNLTLTWTPNQTADTSGASIFTALQEQLGLKLESTRGPVEVIVVDRVERPTPD